MQVLWLWSVLKLRAAGLVWMFLFEELKVPQVVLLEWFAFAKNKIQNNEIKPKEANKRTQVREENRNKNIKTCFSLLGAIRASTPPMCRRTRHAGERRFSVLPSLL